MSPEDLIELEMRLGALEYLLCKLNLAMLAATVPLDQIPARLDQFAEEAGKQLFPGLDPALSDHATGEWQAAIGKLVKAQKEILAESRRRTGT